MGGRKRKSGVWHHRVPDFKLVYWGPEEGFSEKETKLAFIKEVSETESENDSTRSKLEQQKKT